MPHMHSSSVNVKKAIVKQKQVLSIDNNWRNTEICHRSGSVSHADARGSLRRVSQDKEFTPYALNLNIRFKSPGLYETKQSKLQRIQRTFQAWFPQEPSVLESGHACYLHFYLVFQGDLLAPFRACSHGATVSETTQSGPQHSTITVSILITSVLSSASDRLAISSSLSSIFGALICSFIWAIFLYLCTPVT